MANETEKSTAEVAENQEETTIETAETETSAEQNTEAESTPETDDLSVVSAQLEEYKDKYLRLQADFENFRRQSIKRQADLISSGNEKLLTELLPVVDDLDRAMESIAKATDIEAVREGICLIMNKFQGFLQKSGVSEIEAKEQVFDVDKHEAVAKFPAPSDDMKGKVLDVTQKGYTLNGKVMRFAKVVVCE